MVIWQFDGEQG